MTNSSNCSSRINSGTQACAACKYQRRKCAPDCPLAPYFPHDRQKQFLNAHKLFGVSNITKILKQLGPKDKDIAMHTIIFQSDVRAQDPVGGCYRIVCNLNHQLEYCTTELEFVNQQLAICKSQAFKQPQLVQGNQDLLVTISSCNSNDNNTNDNGQIVTDESNYQEFQALMRCCYEDDEQLNVQNCVPIQVMQGRRDETSDHAYSWTMHDQDFILESSNGGVDNHSECYMARPSTEEDDGLAFCGEFEVKPQVHGAVIAGVGPYDDEGYFPTKSDDAQVNVSYDLHKQGIKFEPQETSELISEVIFKNEKDISDDQEDESFPHHHGLCEHDLGNETSLFTVQIDRTPTSLADKL